MKMPIKIGICPACTHLRHRDECDEPTNWFVRLVSGGLKTRACTYWDARWETVDKGESNG